MGEWEGAVDKDNTLLLPSIVVDWEIERQTYLLPFFCKKYFYAGGGEGGAKF